MKNILTRSFLISLVAISMMNAMEGPAARAAAKPAAASNSLFASPLEEATAAFNATLSNPLRAQPLEHASASSSYHASLTRSNSAAPQSPASPSSAADRKARLAAALSKSKPASPTVASILAPAQGSMPPASPVSATDLHRRARLTSALNSSGSVLFPEPITQAPMPSAAAQVKGSSRLLLMGEEPTARQLAAGSDSLLKEALDNVDRQQGVSEAEKQVQRTFLVKLRALVSTKEFWLEVVSIHGFSGGLVPGGYLLYEVPKLIKALGSKSRYKIEISCALAAGLIAQVMIVALAYGAVYLNNIISNTRPGFLLEVAVMLVIVNRAVNGRLNKIAEGDDAARAQNLDGAARGLKPAAKPAAQLSLAAGDALKPAAKAAAKPAAAGASSAKLAADLAAGAFI